MDRQTERLFCPALTETRAVGPLSRQRALFSVQRMKNDIAGTKRRGDINNPLIAGAPEFQFQRAFSQNKRTVHHNVQQSQKRPGLRLPQQGFHPISRIGHKVIPKRLQGSGQRRQRLALTKRLTAAKGHSPRQGIFSDILQDRFQSQHCAARKIMRIRIMAPGAVMRTSLRKQHIPQPRSIHNGLRLPSGHPEPSFFSFFHRQKREHSFRGQTESVFCFILPAHLFEWACLPVHNAILRLRRDHCPACLRGQYRVTLNATRY